MECADAIKILIGGYIPLVGVIVWLIRTGRKDVIRLIKAFEQNTTVLERVERLLSNWRGH